MLAAQTLNDNEQALLGCYVIGRSWYFITLENKEYAISNIYTCTDEGIFDIFRILKAIRWKIETLLSVPALN